MLENKDIAGGIKTPRLRAPAGTCDCHMHIIYPEQRFAFTKGNEGIFSEHPLEAYRAVAKTLGIDRCIVAQTPPYGLDNSNTMAAVKEIGLPARATVAVGPDIEEAELDALDKAGARGANFFMLPGGCLDWDAVRPVAEKIKAFGWHVQIQLDGRELGDYEQALAKLENEIVIDHIGKFLGPADLDHVGFQALLRLVETGKTYVKLSAPNESTTDTPPYMKDAGKRAAALIEAAPERMLWASNWPHLGDPVMSEKPDTAMLLDTLLAWTNDQAIRDMILADNPARLYGFE